MMRFKLFGAAALLALAGGPAAAQSLTPGPVGDIVVTGTRQPGGKPVPMSDWRVAETAHVKGAYESPEQAKARALLEAVSKK